MENNIERIQIDNVDIFIEEMGNGKGKITISDTYDHNYSYFWGAMGGTLKEFLCRINAEYFTQNLLGSRRNYILDVRKTFAVLRKRIAEEVLPWYKHMWFQKEMRETLNSFQRECESEPNQDFFVREFYPSFINSLEFFRIADKHDRKQMENNFKEFGSECWNYIVETEGPEYLWLMKLHGKLKQYLLTEKQSA